MSDSVSRFRPLPEQPNLEFERKSAKELLHALRAGDFDSMARARECRVVGEPHEEQLGDAVGRFKLAHAQLIIAREYGFTSWPRLVRYYERVARMPMNRRPGHDVEFYASEARGVMSGSRRADGYFAHALTAYVPRLMGRASGDLALTTVTEDEARLVVARTNGFPSWALLVRTIERQARTDRRDAWERNPRRAAAEAMQLADLTTLQDIVRDYPELLHGPAVGDAARGHSLLSSALHYERTLGRTAMAPIIDWLIERGADLDSELGLQLCGHFRMQPTEVRDLLHRGANPNWLAPNGVPVLEHALLRYWSGEAVDVLVAGGAKPRHAIWIAAGVGDVDGVDRFLDAAGRPTPRAFELRLDVDAIGGMITFAQSADATGDDILRETFLIALLNGRTHVLEHLVRRGFPVNDRWFGMPWVSLAIGYGMPDVVESLIRSGADLDLRGSRPNQTPREMARSVWESVTPKSESFRRVAILCGHDPDAILAELAKRPVEVRARTVQMQSVLDVAGDDAFMESRATVTEENLLVGLLAAPGSDLVLQWLRQSGADLTGIRRAYDARLDPESLRPFRPSLRLGTDAQQIIDAATEIARTHRRDVLNVGHMCAALIAQPDGHVAQILARHGVDLEQLHSALAGML